MQILSDLVVIVEDEFKVLDVVILDELMGLFNCWGFFILVEYVLLMVQCCYELVSLVFVDFDCFKYINDIWGYEEGDCVLIVIVDLMKVVFCEFDIFVRQGGDEFIILFVNISCYDVVMVMEMFSYNVVCFNQQVVNFWQLVFFWGCVEYDFVSYFSFNVLVVIVDCLMYQVKQKQGCECC